MQTDIERLRKTLIKKAKKQVQLHYSEKDVHVARAVSLLEDIDSAFNLLSEDCIEWYATHFPELYPAVKDNSVYLKIVDAFGEREKMDAKSVLQIAGSPEKAKLIEEKAKKSIGSPLPKSALAEIKMLASNALRLKEERGKLQSFIETEMNAIAPNFSKIAGHVLAARMLAAAGGLKQIALMPSSTVQLLGAEKALFRHLRDKRNKGPKYGYIFGHPLIKATPSRNKGKVARTLAAKIALAARADFFGEKKDIATGMLAEVEKRAKGLK